MVLDTCRSQFGSNFVGFFAVMYSKNCPDKIFWRLSIKALHFLIFVFKVVKGAGGVPDLRMVEIEFYVVCDRGQPQLPDAFYRIEKYCS